MTTRLAVATKTYEANGNNERKYRSGGVRMHCRSDAAHQSRHFRTPVQSGPSPPRTAGQPREYLADRRRRCGLPWDQIGIPRQIRATRRWSDPVRASGFTKGRACMADTTDPGSGGSRGATPAHDENAPTRSHDGPAAAVNPLSSKGRSSTPRRATLRMGTTSEPLEAARPAHPWRRRLLFVMILGGLAYGAYSLVPTIETMLNTVSTDDAYVNGHVTFVAPSCLGPGEPGVDRRRTTV